MSTQESNLQSSGLVAVWFSFRLKPTCSGAYTSAWLSTGSTTRAAKALKDHIMANEIPSAFVKYRRARKQCNGKFQVRDRWWSVGASTVKRMTT